MLGELIERVGLADAGELVALATSQQLAEIFDRDLWRSERAGHDERFAAERFLLWLEVMLEAGERFVAERLAELPQELVTLAFHRHVLVIAFDDLRAELEADDDEAAAAEKAFGSCLSEEIEDFQLISRSGEGWDDLLSALLALDRDHHGLLLELLERCARLSAEHIADSGGLYSVLSAAETLELDLAAARETRRAAQGHVAPSAAAAFLKLARSASGGETAFTEHDPLTRAYFRELGSEAMPEPKQRARSQQLSAPPAAERRDLARLLRDSGITGPVAAPRALGSGKRESAGEPLLLSALRELAQQEPALFEQRSEELAYLANVLLAGCSVDGRRLRPLEAVEHAIAGVSLGLALSSKQARPSPSRALEALRQHPCDGLLRLAWSRASQPEPAKPSRTLPPELAELRRQLAQLKIG